MKKVSVIVTVYNTAKYLRKCIESIINQTYKNIEVVIINDGSIDESEDICLNYAEKYGNIVYHFQENQGLQAARLKGLTLAVGEFVMFVDSDDWVDGNMVEQLVENLGDYDLATSGYIAENSRSNTKRKVHDAIEEGKYSSGTEYKYVLDNFFIYKHERTKGLLNNIAGKLFKRENALKAMELSNIGISIEEDFLFVLCYLLISRSIYVCHSCYYHYIQNEDSMSHSVVKHYLSERELVYTTVIKILQDYGFEYLIPEYQKRFYFDIISGLPLYMKLEGMNAAMFNYFPSNIDSMKGKTVIIYGFGQRGISLYKWIKSDFKDVNVVDIIDLNKAGDSYEDYIIKNLDDIMVENYDYIILTMVDKGACQTVKEKMINCGIEEARIIELETRNLLNVIF